MNQKLNGIIWILLFVSIHFVQAQKQTVIDVVVTETEATFIGMTPPLSELAPMPGLSPEKKAANKLRKKEITNFIGRAPAQIVNDNALPQGEDPVLQGENRNQLFPVLPLVNIEGISSGVSGATPPDPSGEIGKDYYIQMVNATFYKIFDKDGVAVSGNISANTIWSSIGFSSAGDPIILYDQEAERWYMTEFIFPGNTLLLAVSVTSDPTGSWMAYSFNTPNFPDYPKWSLWNNALCVTTNEQGPNTLPSYFIDRSALLAGAATVDMQRVEIPGIGSGPGFQVGTPVDWTGSVSPPSGANPMILRLNDDAWGGSAQDQIDVFEVNIDWSNSANTTVTNTSVITAAFDTNPCSAGGGGFSCIPQPNGQGIDGLPEVIMNQVHYRNFGSHESIVLNFIVDATGSNLSGIRWMELRRTGGNWSVYQEGTYAPNDGLHRFMGGIAIDASGNIGLAYSVSGTGENPGIRYTGRRASDPLGQMTVDEFTAVSGGGSSNGDRYGDYAQMGVDPVNQRTFWYTGEYIKGGGQWATRIVAFELSRDTIDIGPTAMLTPADSPNLGATEAVQIEVKNFGIDPQTTFNVGYSVNGAPPVVETVTTSLAPDATYIHTFTPTVDMSTIGAYDFLIFTDLTGDTAPFNDTLRLTVTKQTRFDAGISSVDGINAVNCGTELLVDFILENFGTEPLTSTTIEITVGGMVIETINWTGNLAPGASAAVSVNLTGLVDGVNNIGASTSLPNGMADQDTSNDAFSRPITVETLGIGVTLNINTDDYPDETTWDLTDENGTILFSGGPYTGTGTLYSENWCLSSTECYNFTIYDAYGDGICCGWGTGFYNIQDADGNFLVNGTGDFGSSETSSICPGGSCTQDATIDITDASGSGVMDGVIMVTPVGGVGPFQYSIDGGATFQPSGTFTGLAAGSYDVQVQGDGNCFYAETVMVGVNTGTINLTNTATIEILPNPTNGVFRVNIEGLDRTETMIDFEIFDSSGKRVQTNKMARYSGVYTGQVSIVAYPPGVYFLKFIDPQINRLVRVVKQ